MNATVSEVISTITTLKNLVMSSAFLSKTSISKNVRDNEKDIFGLLDDIQAKEYTNSYDFYTDIRKAFESYSSSAFHFIPPCTSSFYVVLPCSFNLTTEDDKTVVRAQKIESNLITERLILEINNTNSELYNPSLANAIYNMLGKVVTKIEIKEQTRDKEDEPPETTIAHWAAENVYLSSTLAGKTDLAFREYFFKRNLAYFDFPVNKITVIYKDDNGADAVVELPFYGLSTRNINSSDEVCPLYAPNSESSKGNGNFDNKSLRFSSKIKNKKNEEILKEHKLSMDRIKEEWERADKLNRENFELMSKIKSLRSSNTKLLSNEEDDTSDVKQNERISNSRKLHRLFGKRQRNYEDSYFVTNDDGDMYIHRNSTVKGMIFKGDGENVTVLSIPNWKVEENQKDDFFSTIVDVLSASVANNCTELIIDISGNEDDDLSTMLFLINLLFPQFWPPFFEFYMPVTNVTRLISDSFNENENLRPIKLDSFEYIEMIKSEPYSTEDIEKTEGGEVKIVTRNLTNNFRLYSSYVDDWINSGKIPENINPEKVAKDSMFAADKLTVYASGYCPYTSGLFMAFINQNSLGSTFTSYDLFYNPENTPLTIGESIAYGIYDLQTLYNYKSMHNDSPDLPDKFLRVGADLQFPVFPALSLEQNKEEARGIIKKILIEVSKFAVKKVPNLCKFGYNYFKNGSLAEDVKNLIKLKQIPDSICYVDGSVKTIDTCIQTDEGKIYKNRVYGYACRADKNYTYDSSKCVVGKCKKGYKENENSECVHQPSRLDKILDSSDSFLSKGVEITFIVLFCVCFVAAVGFGIGFFCLLC